MVAGNVSASCVLISTRATSSPMSPYTRAPEGSPDIVVSTGGGGPLPVPTPTALPAKLLPVGPETPITNAL